MKAQNLIHSLGETLINALKIPFSHYSLVNEDRVLDLVEELEASLPQELEEAEKILAERDKILAEARHQAEEVVAAARAQAHVMVTEDEITKAAIGEAERIRVEFEIEHQRQQVNAERYADEVLSDLESKLSRALSTVQNGRQALTAS